MADMGEVIWDKPKEVPEWVIENVDENVLASQYFTLGIP